MRISIILGPFQPLPPAGMGAVEKVWCELARVFAARGHDVTIFGKATPESGETGVRLGVQMRFVRGFEASGLIAWDLIRDLLYAFRVAPQVEKSDVVVTNTFWMPVVLGPLKRWKGRILVHVARFPKGQMRLYRAADLLQAISSAVGKAITEEVPAMRDRVRVLGYPVDLSVFRPQGLDSGTSPGPSVVYVGRIHPEKGLHLLIEAFRLVAQQVPEATLEVVGPFDESQGGGGAAYLRGLEAAGEGLRIRFRGPIADEHALADACRKAACFCYPSVAERGEAFGRAVLEAMACGTPCVVSALDCFRDFVRDGENALVFDHRAADAAERLAGAICSILADSVLAARLGRAARTEAGRFSTERIAEEYLRMFESLAPLP